MRERGEVLREFAEKHNTECHCSDCFEVAMENTMDDMADEIVRLREALDAATRVTDEMVDAMSQHVYQYALTTLADIRAGLTAALGGPRDE